MLSDGSPYWLDSCREKLMIEISRSEPHYIPYIWEYTDYEKSSISVELNVGLSNQRGYSDFQLYKDK